MIFNNISKVDNDVLLAMYDVLKKEILNKKVNSIEVLNLYIQIKEEIEKRKND